MQHSTDHLTGKASNIISMFERGLDGREIARKLRFNSYQEMADYMKSKGMNGTETNTIPRYILNGIATQNTIVMVSTFIKIVKDFCEEKNISQRELFEVTVIEFLKKYGFSDEV